MYRQASERSARRYVLCILCFTLVFVFVYTHNLRTFCAGLAANNVSPPVPCEFVDVRTPDAPPKTWFEAAATTKTDKITTHAYDYAYDKYLPRIHAQKKVKLLEIGLGCDMTYGPGESLKVWLEYFKDAELELHFMEFDATCASEWQPKYPHIQFHVGDQANPQHLERVLKNSGGNFDVIVDDGGHTAEQQIVSLEYLLPRGVKPGGLYVVEDLISSFYWGGYKGFTTHEYVANLVANMHKSEFPNTGGFVRTNTLHEHVLSVDAMRGIVVFTTMPTRLPPGLRGKELI